MAESELKQVQLVCLAGDSAHWEDLVSFVAEHDQEFLPPISHRMAVVDYIERFHNDNGIVIVALDAGRIAGCMATFLSHPERGTPFVQYAAVSKEHRGAGIASMLLERSLRELADAGCSRIESRTWSANTASQKLLESHGFTLSERLVDDRGPGVDTLIYARTIYS